MTPGIGPSPGLYALNCNLDYVAQLKGVVDIPLVCAGRMCPEEGAAAIQAGCIDAMGVARQFLTDPEWVTKMLEDREADIKPCICCHNACFTMLTTKGWPTTRI